MEGNECYKFTTVANYTKITGADPIEVVLDIGANIGSVTRQMRHVFPRATILAFEPVPEYYDVLASKFVNDPQVSCHNIAVSSSHLYEDDLGRRRRPEVERLRVMKAKRNLGGSVIIPSSRDIPCDQSHNYVAHACKVTAKTLDDVVALALHATGKTQVDFVKIDCEGCEHSCLGAASADTLQRIRFIGGEYHGIARFFNVMRHRLFDTHYVNLVGDGQLGSFFAERVGATRSILEPSREGMLKVRPALCPEPIEWHVFRDEFVLPRDRRSCALR